MVDEIVKNTCEVCGDRIYGRTIRARIEGVILIVCSKCASLGEPIVPQKRSQFSSPREGSPQYSHSPYKSLPENRKVSSSKPEPEEGLTLIKGYGRIILKIREKLKLDQIQFAQKIQIRTSLLQRWEQEKVEPTLKEARDLEKLFQVKLVKKIEEEDDSLTSEDFQKFRASGKATMGDFIKVRKKK